MATSQPSKPSKKILAKRKTKAQIEEASGYTAPITLIAFLITLCIALTMSGGPGFESSAVFAWTFGLSLATGLSIGLTVLEFCLEEGKFYDEDGRLISQVGVTGLCLTGILLFTSRAFGQEAFDAVKIYVLYIDFGLIFIGVFMAILSLRFKAKKPKSTPGTSKSKFGIGSFLIVLLALFLTLGAICKAALYFYENVHQSGQSKNTVTRTTVTKTVGPNGEILSWTKIISLVDSSNIPSSPNYKKETYNGGYAHTHHLPPIK